MGRQKLRRGEAPEATTVDDTNDDSGAASPWARVEVL